MHLWTRDRHLCDGLSQRHRWTCARHLCGNKISDAPRHRRDLVPVTASFHTVRHGIVLDESRLIIVVQLQLCAVARHAAKFPVQQAQIWTGAEHRSGWPDRHVQTWSARCAGASRDTSAGVGSCSGNTTRIADAIAPSCWPLIEPRPQFLLRTRRFFFDGSLASGEALCDTVNVFLVASGLKPIKPERKAAADMQRQLQDAFHLPVDGPPDANFQSWMLLRVHARQCAARDVAWNVSRPPWLDETCLKARGMKPSSHQ